MKLNSNTSLKLISFFPLLLLLALSTYFVYSSYSEYQKNISLENKIYSNKILKNLSINLAKERGISASYYGSNGKGAKNALKIQRIKTNKAIREFNNYYKNKPIDATLTRIFKGLTKIPSVRVSVNNLSIGFNKMFFGYYSTLNKLIYNEYRKIVGIQLTPEISSEVLFETKLLEDIERSGQERGFISYILAKKRPFSTKEFTIWMKLFSNADLSTLNIQIADLNLKNKLFVLFHGTRAKQLYSKLIKAKINIISGSDIGYYQIEPSKWFNLMTKKVTLLNRADMMVSANIGGHIKNLFENKIRPQLTLAGGVFILAIFLMIIGFFIDKYIRRSIKELEKLFSKVGQLADIDEGIDFQTTEGIDRGYRIIEIAIDQIQQDKRIALEASKAKSIFLANMSHEIRTPLNGIIGFTELLKNTSINGEERDFVDIIEKSSENLLEIINNILDLSKIESDKIEVEEILFAPITEFENAVEVFAAKASEKNIRLSFYIDPGLNNYLNGDPTKIKEVLINLLSNAVKFTPIDGEVDVEIKRMGNTDAFGRTKVQFAVKDNGVGISQDKLKTIFDAFSQADSTITRKYGGTGLGLTISSKFISLMGGKLEVESKEGEGTIFFFTLEFDESPSSEANFNDKFTEYRCALLASETDKKNHTQYIYDYLKYFGCDIVFFHSYKEVKGLMFRENINFIILDVDYIKDDEIEDYKKMQIPSIVILKSSMQSISNKYTNEFIKSLYEPVNVTKMVSILEKEKESLSKVKHLSEQKQEDENTDFKENVQEDTDSQVTRVLVAEDNEINRKLIKRTLENYDISVTLSNDGEEAMEEVKSRKFDLIFMDIAMPVMDGVEALHAILNYELNTGTKHTPIIALTANALKGDRERFLNEGFDEYVTKPIRSASIESILTMFLKDKVGLDKEADENISQEIIQEDQENSVDEVTYSLKDDEFNDDIKKESDSSQEETKKLKVNFETFENDFFDLDKTNEKEIEDVEKSLFDEDTSKNEFAEDRIDKIKEEELENMFAPIIEKVPLAKTEKHIEERLDRKDGEIDALIAEDNIINQKLIEKTLKNLGLNVEIANNGEEALEMFKNKKYDIVFMDISMPVMDGIEATHEILAYENINNLEHTPVVALTANALPGDREAFLSEGLDEYISKPLKKEDIIKVLKIFLGYNNGDTPKIEEVNNDFYEIGIGNHNDIFEKGEKFEEDIQIEEENKKIIEEKDVLILKNNKIEAKILNNMINKLGFSAEFINSFDQFIYNINSKQYKIVFFDKNIEFVKSKEIIEKIQTMNQSNDKKISIVEFVSVQDINKDEDLPIVDEVIDNVIDKKNIRRILEKYIR